VSSCGEAESRRAHEERDERNANDQTAHRYHLPFSFRVDVAIVVGRAEGVLSVR
jgi:hypothetical protein